MEITEMTLDDLEQMKNTLYSDFDNFCSYNVLKQELENDKTKYIIAKEKNEVVGFAGISVIFDEATLNNIVVKKSYRGKGIGGEMLETLIDLCSDMNLKTFTLEDIVMFCEIDAEVAEEFLRESENIKLCEDKFEYIEGKISKEEAIEKIKLESRRYAKRQLTWFRKNKQTTWLNGEDKVANNIHIILEEMNK